MFDSRGLGNTTSGSKPYTYQQLANDSAGLLDALKIPKADVMGYSLGLDIAEQLAITYPDKVKSLVNLLVHHAEERIIHLNHLSL